MSVLLLTLRNLATALFGRHVGFGMSIGRGQLIKPQSLRDIQRDPFASFVAPANQKKPLRMPLTRRLLKPFRSF